MPELTIQIQVPWPKDPTLGNFEKAIFRVLMAAGRDLLKQAFEVLEPTVLKGAKQRRRRRYLVTRFGEIRFMRWQTKTEGGYRYPLDRALGLLPKDPCSPWVKEKASWLAQAHPYRQAAHLFSMMIGDKVDFRRLWNWVQRSGERLIESWEEKRRRIFEDGELPPRRNDFPAIVSTSVDGTYIRTRDGPIEVKLGVWWTGAHLESETAAHPRYILDGKGFFATTDQADDFGQVFYALAEDKVAISQAKEVYAVSDGAGWCVDVPRQWINPTHYQLDHFHGKMRINEVAKDPDRAARWWGWAAESNLDALGRSIYSYMRSGQVDPEAAVNLLRYFHKGAAALHTYLALREKGFSAQMAPRGSGVVEHAVDLVVARRFKRQGMRSWSRAGANNLLALRVLARDPRAWRAWWGDAMA